MNDEEKYGGGNGNALRGGPPPSETVIKMVAEAEGTDPVTLPLLYEVIDPDALDTLFRRQGAGHVEFTYAGYEVAVTAGGPISVHDRTE